MLEIICTNLEDAIAAVDGGADRLELISRFDVGGLTPSLEIIESVLASVSIPVRVMVRDIEDFRLNDHEARRSIVSTAKQVARFHPEGIVCGFLSGHSLDIELLTEVVATASPCQVTFHRAFEELSDPLSAIGQMKRLPAIDTILTSGGNSRNRIEFMKELSAASLPEIEILAGGGMTLELMQELAQGSGIRAFHFGTAVREGKRLDGKVLPEQIGLLRQALDTCLNAV